MQQLQKPKQGYRLAKSLFGKYEEIPEDWNIKKLLEVGEIVGGGTPDSTKKEYWNGSIWWAVPTDITKLSGNFIDKTERTITELGLEESSAKLLPPNSILITSRATIGEYAINLVPMSTNQGFQSIICNSKNNNLFIYYATKFHKNTLLRLAYGTTFLEISKSEMKKVKIPIPESYKEQQKIASILSNIDSLIQQTQKEIEQTQRLKKGLMQKLCTKGIGHTKFKTEILSPKVLKFEIPDTWKFVKLSKITNQITDGTHFTPEYVDDGVPFLRITDIQDKQIDWIKVKKIKKEEHMELIKRCNPQKGDILFSKNGTVGISKIVDWDQEFSCFVSLCLIKPNKENILTEFLFYLLGSDLIKEQIMLRSKQLSISNLHLEEIREFDIPLPPFTEQQKIASILSNIDSQIQVEEEYKSKIETLKKGLMQKLLTGQIRVKV